MIRSDDVQVRPGWDELGRYLLDTGAMAPEWAEHFNAVDRSLFLPYTMWPFTEKAGHTVVRASDPEEWFRWVDADVPITTQWDDGEHSGTAPGRVPTSSASMPSLVMSMLADLDVPDHARVLEIGTGAGWNAGLLVHRLGGRNVTTVEVDRQVATRAQSDLHSAGLRPYVVQADGAQGHLANAPYDRVIATCGVRSIPPAWIGQIRTGGVIVAPWGTAYGNQDAVVRLVVHRDSSVSGHFTRPAQFVKMRAQRAVWPEHAQWVPDDWADRADKSSTAVTSDEFAGGPYDVASFVIGLRVPHCAAIVEEASAWFYGLADRSWAAVKFGTDGVEGEAYQFGARRLWDEVVEARRWWADAGRPGIERFGLTIGPEGQHVWLDEPKNRF